MDIAQIALMVSPAFAVFGALGWVLIYLQTYQHFPKMERARRISLSAANATILIAVILGIAFLGVLYLAANLASGG